LVDPALYLVNPMVRDLGENLMIRVFLENDSTTANQKNFLAKKFSSPTALTKIN